MNRALLVGINAYPTQPLNGCVNDVEDIAAYLIEKRKWDPHSIVPLFDQRATKSAIVRALKNMISSSRDGDNLYFHYSGHGAQIKSADFTENDGLDEVLCPVDFDWSPASAILDNDLRQILDSVPSTVTMTVTLDSCHSGDMERDPLRDSKARVRCLQKPPDVVWRFHGSRLNQRTLTRSQNNTAVISACSSFETAKDTDFDGRANGAFTYFFLKQLSSEPTNSALVAAGKVEANVGIRYHMHPVCAGSDVLLNRPFLSEDALRNLLHHPEETVIVRSEGGQEWRSVLDALIKTSEYDCDVSRKFREASCGLELKRGALEELFMRMEHSGNGSRRMVSRTFVWGWQIAIDHEEVQAFLATAGNVNAIATMIAPIGGPASPYIAGIATMVSLSLTLLRSIDAGHGIYISMLWIAPGIFVPTTK